MTRCGMGGERCFPPCVFDGANSLLRLLRCWPLSHTHTSAFRMTKQITLPNKIQSHTCSWWSVIRTCASRQPTSARCYACIACSLPSCCVVPVVHAQADTPLLLCEQWRRRSSMQHKLVQRCRWGANSASSRAASTHIPTACHVCARCVVSYRYPP